MRFLPALCFLVLSVFLCGVIAPVSPYPPGQAATYSIMHISDLQSLTTYYPETLDLTFTTLESMKEPSNISAVVITGDLVNTWDDVEEWDAYSRARNLTSIPVYEIAGNHDTGNGNFFRLYTERTGMPEKSYGTAIGDFDLIGINFARKTLSPDELCRLREYLAASPRSHAIIATHYYMDGDGTLSPPGNAIDMFLIDRPTLVLMGHMHGNFIRQRTVRGFPVVAGMTNYQDGIPGGTTGWNYAGGTLYTVTSVNGTVRTIAARTLRMYPVVSSSEERIVFPPDNTVPYPPGLTRPAGTLFPVYRTLPDTCGAACRWNMYWQQTWTDVCHMSLRQEGT